MKLIGFKELNGCNSCLESLYSNISDVEYETRKNIELSFKKKHLSFVRLDILVIYLRAIPYHMKIVF